MGQLAARRPGPRFRATGTSATYVIQDVDGQEAQLRGGASPSSKGEQRGVEPPERWGHLRRGEAAEPVPSARGAWNLFYPAFAAAVRGTQPTPVDQQGTPPSHCGSQRRP